MGVTEVLCNYIYSSFQKLKAALEKIEKVCKEYIKKIIKVADTAKNFIRMTVSDAVKKINQSIEDIRKNIKPLLIDGPGKLPILCDDLWKCLALLQELLDSGSAFYKSIKKNLLNKCTSSRERNIADDLSQLITDFTKFRDIVCNSSFGIEFSIDAIKLSLKTFKLSAINYDKLLGKKWKFLNGQLDTYLHFAMDQGLCDFLNALIKFFNCAFGTNFSEIDSEINIDLNPCAEISTAQNFFNDVLATCHLIQCGDSYELDPEFRAYLMSTIESFREICQGILDNIDELNNIMVNPIEVKVGFKGYENAAHVFPGKVTGKDIKNAWNNTVAAVNGVKTGQWTAKTLYRKFRTNRDDIVNAFIEKKTKKTIINKKTGFVEMNVGSKSVNVSPAPSHASTISPVAMNNRNSVIATNGALDVKSANLSNINRPGKTSSSLVSDQKSLGNKYSKAWILSHTFQDEEGNVYVLDGCDMIMLDNLPHYDGSTTGPVRPVMTTYMTDGADISGDEMIMDPVSGDLINLTECAIKISEDPNSPLAIRCKQIWSTINNMYSEQDIVRKY